MMLPSIMMMVTPLTQVLRGDGVPEKIVGGGSPAAGVSVEVGLRLLQIRRMKVGRTKTNAAGQGQLEEIGRGARYLAIVHSEPSSALQKPEIRRRQQIGGRSECSRVVEDTRGEGQGGGIPIRGNGIGRTELEMTTRTNLREQRAEVILPFF